MAKYKQVEFAELCRVPRTYLPPYIKNGKIVMVDKLIDEDNPINQMFIQKCHAKNPLPSTDTSEEIPAESPGKNPGPFSPPISQSVKKERRQSKGGDKSDYAATLVEMNELKNIKLEEEIELLKKRNMKMDGESIPTAAVLSVVSFFGKSYTDGTNQMMENILNQISTRKALTASEHAEFRGLIIKGINEVATRANKECKKNISNIVKEVSVQRGVGEHD